jgi:uncharacterized protein (TIGR02145 family)
MKKSILLFVFIYFMAANAFSQTGSITNVQVAQRSDGSGLVDVNFDLEGPADSYFISMKVSFDAGINYIPISTASMSGNVGPSSPGSKHIVWNPTVDHPNRYSPQTKLKLTAYLAGNENPCPGAPTVEDIDGNVYQTLQISDQCWMASNLNTTRSPSGVGIARICYSNAPSNCELYGGLYSWTTMMNGSASSNGNPSGVQGICPTGWHVPSDAEWTELTDYLINTYVDITASNVSNKLKSCRQVDSPLGGDCSTTTHPRWDSHSSQYGTNDFGFSALPGGGYQGGSFVSLGLGSNWWSSTANAANSYYDAWFRQMWYTHGGVSSVSLPKLYGYAVRCVRD